MIAGMIVIEIEEATDVMIMIAGTIAEATEGTIMIVGIVILIAEIATTGTDVMTAVAMIAGTDTIAMIVIMIAEEVIVTIVIVVLQTKVSFGDHFRLQDCVSDDLITAQSLSSTLLMTCQALIYVISENDLMKIGAVCFDL